MAQILPDHKQDAALLAALKGGEEKAMEVIFRLHYADLCRAVLRIIPSPEIAEDIGQDVLLELWRKRAQVQINTSLAAYLRRAGVNRALNYLRDQKMKFDQDADLEYHAPITPAVTQELEAEELKQKIDEAIDALPERCRVVFVLSRFEDMSYQNIADTLDISVKTVENQITKALRILRDRLEGFLS
ncbi:MAG TPA: RNA polymerase sigma-70 factor [Saprospiraceae bacterium]|nr:RNA polymerase sigma-70 factor [Saprospiraceae bacterium]HMQ85116.1 RNA polymerase sigma-70 factor [Saprospiraceae bacterium]